MWTAEHRRAADCRRLCYPSDLTDAEWALIGPMIPPAKPGGRKRHIMVDTLGLILGIVVHSGDVQDRDGARDLLRRTRRRFPFIEVIFADGGYQGPRMAATGAKTGASRSSSATTCHASRCCPSAGSSSVPSPGSAATGASPMTSSATSGPWSPSSGSP